MGDPVQSRSCPLRRRLIIRLANGPVPPDAETRVHLLAALRDLEVESIQTHRPATTLQAIRSAIGMLDTSRRDPSAIHAGNGLVGSLAK